MRKKLAIIALSSFALSALCLGGAYALGGRDIANSDFNFAFGERPACPASSSATATSRTLPWTDGDSRAAVAVPANAHWQSGSGDALVVKGDPAVISHIRIRDGVVELDCQTRFFRSGASDRIDVTLPGRNFHSFALMGSGDLNLAGVSQPDVKISLMGSGDIEASGKTQQLEATMLGSGRLRLGDLTAQDADIHIAGSGDIEAAPQGELHANIAGSGDIELKSEPKQIDTAIHGSGRIRHPDGRSDTMRGERHASWDYEDGKFEARAEKRAEKEIEKYRP